jgi:hypothetical protein
MSGLAIGFNKEFFGKQNVHVLDNESIYLWMDNYCPANPLKRISDGAEQLFVNGSTGRKSDFSKPTSGVVDDARQCETRRQSSSSAPVPRRTYPEAASYETESPRRSSVRFENARDPWIF